MARAIYEYKTIGGVKNRIHRHIMEEFLGRPLDANEHVYHINGDPHDNAIENLVVVLKNAKIKKRIPLDSAKNM